MPVQLSSFLLPRNGNTWFVLEDKYLKGGLQVVANQAVRDSINPINLKSGQLVVTQDDNRLWQLQPDLVTWFEFISSVVYNPFYTHKQFVPDSVWTVFHEKGCKYFTYGAYDENGSGIMPDSVDIIDVNTVIMTFIVPVAGHCTLAFDQNQS
jgi:hypothetical protein